MPDYFEKARELGEMIRESEQSIRLADARAAFAASPEAVRKAAEFREFEKNAQSGGIENAEALRKSPVIGELIAAEEEYLALLDQVIEVLRMTVLGDEADGQGTGKCVGCAGCGVST